MKKIINFIDLKNKINFIKNCIKLADYFDCSVDFLVGMTDEPKKYSFNNNFNKKVFFSRYTQLLKEKNLSHYALSAKLNLSMSSLKSWEKGGIPYLETLSKLAQYFDVSVDYLIGRSNYR